MNDDIKPSGKAKGGVARAAKMTPEERKQASLRMVQAKARLKSMPMVTHDGVLKILDVEIPCYVLSNGQRVLSQRGIAEAFTGKRGGGTADGAQKLPRFLAKKDIKSFISNELLARINSPIEFLPRAGRSAFGFDANLLPEICEIIIDASRFNNTTDDRQYEVADRLIRGFARVGIAALVDEATGYQKDRAKDELAKILEAFVAKELQPYMKTFPSDFYENLFRLRGLPFPPVKANYRPQYFGLLTNDIVYERIAPGLLEELKKQSRKDEKKAHLHRRLTHEVGHPKLREHLAAVIMAMKLSKDYPDFISKLNQFFPRFGDSYRLELDELDRG